MCHRNVQNLFPTFETGDVKSINFNFTFLWARQKMVFIQIEEECCCSDATNVGSAVFVAVVVVIVVVVGFTLRENKYVERENACLRREERTMSV